MGVSVPRTLLSFPFFYRSRLFVPITLKLVLGNGIFNLVFKNGGNPQKYGKSEKARTRNEK